MTLTFALDLLIGKWDNNHRSNFIIPIEPAPVLCTPNLDALYMEIPTLKTFYHIKNKIKLTFYKLFSKLFKKKRRI